MTGRSPLFDSHLHLTDERFGGDVDAVLASARDAGVTEMVTVGTGPDDARRARDLAAREEGVWATAGVHPHRASLFDEGVVGRLAELLEAPEVVAVGESGLDYHYENSPRDDQLESFRAHVELARRSGLPLVVHSRDADGQTAELIRDEGEGVRGVLHCFTGGDVLLETALDAGWYVSFSGIVTFASFDGADHVRRVPADRLLVETDSPYLAPEPERGRRNEPAFVAHTCRRVAELRDAMLSLREAGKHVVVHLDGGGDPEVYLASAAERVYLTPAGSLEAVGVHVSLTYFAGLLFQLGIRAEAVSAGDYKTAPRTFTATEPSAEELEVQNDILDLVFERLVEARG
ncbi:MAG: TatD family hydrolase, partial [Gemmatimonadota bacterium]